MGDFILHSFVLKCKNSSNLCVSNSFGNGDRKLPLRRKNAKQFWLRHFSRRPMKRETFCILYHFYPKHQIIIIKKNLRFFFFFFSNFSLDLFLHSLRDMSLIRSFPATSQHCVSLGSRRCAAPFNLLFAALWSALKHCACPIPPALRAQWDECRQLELSLVIYSGAKESCKYLL